MDRISIDYLTQKPIKAQVTGKEQTNSLCPFYDGVETLDLLLGEIGPEEIELLDATLDLRNALFCERNAQHCLQQLFRVRALLDGRHYLAFYRVRRLISRLILAQTRPDWASPWTTQEVPLNCARLDELVNLCIAPLAAKGEMPATARIRFRFA